MHIFIHDYGGYPFTKQLAIYLATKGLQVDYVYSTSTQQVQRTLPTFNTPKKLNAIGISLNTSYEKYNLLKRRKAEIEHGNQVAKLIRQREPDIVISANTPLDALKIIYKASKNRDASFIFWLQDVISIATKKALNKKIPFLGTLIGKYYESIEKRIARQSEKIILISDEFLSLMNMWKIKEGNLHVIPNWAPIDQFDTFEKENEWSNQNGLNKTFNFMYTGILGIKHDPEIFIELASSFAKNPEIRIVIISGGAKFEWLKEKKRQMNLDNLILLDFQPADKYPEVLASADVLMSILNQDASTYSVPSKILSYLCAGRPILLSVDLNNHAAEIINNSKSGLVSAPNKHDDFLNNAVNLVNQPEIRENMSQSARIFAENNFNIETISNEFITIFNRL